MTPSKLGQWVFRVEECPKNATVAVVNRDSGRLVWWRGEQPNGFVPLDNGHWLAKGGSIKGEWIPSRHFNLSTEDWPHCIVYKVDAKNTASDYTVFMAE